jgi:hypothetical protein
MKSFLCYLAGIFSTLFVFGILGIAYTERGYWAIGGEWILIIVGLLGYGLCMYNLPAKQKEASRKRVEKLIAEKELEECLKKYSEKLSTDRLQVAEISCNNLHVLTPEKKREIEEILEREG